MKKQQTNLVLADPIQVNIAEQNKSDLEAYAEEVLSNRAVVSIYASFLCICKDWYDWKTND